MAESKKDLGMEEWRTSKGSKCGMGDGVKNRRIDGKSFKALPLCGKNWYLLCGNVIHNVVRHSRYS